VEFLGVKFCKPSQEAEFCPAREFAEFFCAREVAEPCSAKFIAPQALELLVYVAVLFDEKILPGDVSLGLIIIVVADEILDVILRKKAFKFTIKLCRERFVMRHYESRNSEALDDICHGKSFARARNSEKSLVFVAALKALDDAFDRFFLILARGEFALDFKILQNFSFFKAKIG